MLPCLALPVYARIVAKYTKNIQNIYRMTRFGFDISSGEQLIGQAAIDMRMEQNGPDVVSLPELLTAEHFPFETGDYELLDTRTWTPEDYRIWGIWAVNVLREAPEPTAFNREHAVRLRTLGLGPVVKRLGEFTTFRASLAVSLIPKGPVHAKNAARERPDFYNWTEIRFVRYARRVAERVGRRPRAADYDQSGDHLPSAWAIRQHFGSIATLNEHIGYPNYGEWQPADFVEYGLHFIKANGYEPGIFVPYLFDVVAQKERGPWRDRVAKVFGSWGDYKIQVLKEFSAERKRKTARYRTMVETGRLPGIFRNLDDGAIDQTAAKYLVISELIKGMNEDAKAQLALIVPLPDLLRHLKSHDRTISNARLAGVAAKAGVYDDMFAPPYASYLALTPDEIDQAIIKTRENGARNRARRRARQEPPRPQAA